MTPANASSTRGGSGRHGEGRPGRGDRGLRGLALAGLLLTLALPLAGCRWADRASGAGAGGDTATATEVGVDADRDAGVPTRISIPSIEVEAAVTGVGLQDDGAMQVPDFAQAGWYKLGPRPGAAGPAVIVGHVDSKKGPAVFYRLRDLKRDARIEVVDDRGDAHQFKVERVERHPKDALPIEDIWQATDRPLLRLITCTGTFDRSTGHYRDNLVVYAALVA